MNPSLLQSLAGMAILLSACCTGCLWVGRRIVREELEDKLNSALSPIRQDIEALRMATFNHLSHGEKPDESQIRKALGYGERLY